MSGPHPPAEFDEYSEGYEGGSEDSFKRMLGGGQISFIEVKADWLIRDLASRRRQDSRLGPAPRLLDYGCGTGILLAVLRRLGFGGTLEGCDVSSGMLEEAAQTWKHGDLPNLQLMEGHRAPYADGIFDVIVVSGVLHHVEPAQREPVYQDLVRLLTPGGRVYVFEHNPLNPVTRWVVSRVPIDKNAVLLNAAEAREGLSSVGLERIRTRYLMFFPPRLRVLRYFENWLRWCPMGGQYVAGGSKPR